jgi:hypothetical protein
VEQSPPKATDANCANENGHKTTHANQDHITKAHTNAEQNKSGNKHKYVGSVEKHHYQTTHGQQTISLQETQTHHWQQRTDHATADEGTRA